MRPCPTCDGRDVDWGEACLQCCGSGKVDNDGLPIFDDDDPEPLTDQEERERDCPDADQHSAFGCRTCGMEPLR